MAPRLQVLEWAAQHVPGTAGGPGRFESEPAWRMAVSKRRAAAVPHSTFLQDMLQALAETHVSIHQDPCTPTRPGLANRAAGHLMLASAHVATAVWM